MEIRNMERLINSDLSSYLKMRLDELNMTIKELSDKFKLPQSLLYKITAFYRRSFGIGY